MIPIDDWSMQDSSFCYWSKETFTGISVRNFDEAWRNLLQQTYSVTAKVHQTHIPSCSMTKWAVGTFIIPYNGISETSVKIPSWSLRCAISTYKFQDQPSSSINLIANATCKWLDTNQTTWMASIHKRERCFASWRNYYVNNKSNYLWKTSNISSQKT